VYVYNVSSCNAVDSYLHTQKKKLTCSLKRKCLKKIFLTTYKQNKLTLVIKKFFYSFSTHSVLLVTTTIVFLTTFLDFGNHRIYIYKRFLIHLVTFKSFICFWFFGRFQFNKNNCFGFLNKNAESRSVFRNNRWRCGVEKSKFACALFEQ